MHQTAKIFMNGRSQAVRLPAEFRFDSDEVYIRRDQETGEVIISRKPDDWASFFELQAKVDVPNDFMAERDNDADAEKDLF